MLTLLQQLLPSHIYYGFVVSSIASSWQDPGSTVVAIKTTSGSFLGSGFGVGSSLSDFLGDLDLPMARGTDFHELLNVLLVGGGKVVGRTTVVRNVQTDFLLEWIDTEHAKSVKHQEEGGHDSKDPPNNPHHSDKLDKEKVGIRAVVEPSAMVGIVTSDSHKLGVGKQTNSEDTPQTVGKVDGDGIDGIINLHHDEELGEEVVNHTSNNSNDACCKRADNRASSGDTDQTSERTVHGHGQIVRNLATDAGVDDRVEEHGRDATRGGCQGGSDGTKGGSGGRIRVVNDQSGTGVESIPSKPENKGSEDLEGNGVGREGVGSLQGVAILVVEATLSGSEDYGGDKSGGTTRHMNNTGSGKVDNTDSTERVVTEGGQETVTAPDGVDDNGVDLCFEMGNEEEKVRRVIGESRRQRRQYRKAHSSLVQQLTNPVRKTE